MTNVVKTRRLPVFRLGRPIITRTISEEITASLFAMRSAELASGERTARTIFDETTGRLTYLDRRQLWNPDATPETVPSQADARHQADAWLQKRGLWDLGLENRVRPRPGWEQSSRHAVFDAHQRTVTTPCDHSSRPDVHVCSHLMMTVEHPDSGETLEVPAVGPGAKSIIAYGDRGAIISLHHSQLVIDGAFDVDVVPESASREEFVRTLSAPVIRGSHQCMLAYRRHRHSDGTFAFWPVWLHEAIVEVDGTPCPSKQVALPAAVNGLPALWTAGGETGRDVHRVGAAGGAPEAAACWLDETPASAANAAGFMRAAERAGWGVRFRGPNTLARIVEWTDPGGRVETTDLVFYSGHAGGSGWKLFDPTTGGYRLLAPTEARFGQVDLNWIVISACGPLQDACVPGESGSAFKWARAFDGLHMLLGYAGSIFDLEEEGALFASFVFDDRLSVKDAWLAAAMEQQTRIRIENPENPVVPSWPGVLYSRRYGEVGARDTSVWEAGATVRAPFPADEFVALWTPA